MIFRDRIDAGKQLSELLTQYKGKDVIVLGLPRGGVVVAHEVARSLGAQLDVIVARKLGAPWNPEFGIGAIAPGGVSVIDRSSTKLLGLTEAQIEILIEKEKREMDERIKAFRGDRPFPSLAGRIVILVDDGLATGVTARAAIKFIKKHNPEKLVLAVPVCAYDSSISLRKEVDDLQCLSTPSEFRAVGNFYYNFSQTTNEEVIALLDSARTWENKGLLTEIT